MKKKRTAERERYNKKLKMNERKGMKRLADVLDARLYLRTKRMFVYPDDKT